MICLRHSDVLRLCRKVMRCVPLLSRAEDANGKKNDTSLTRYDIRLTPHDIFAKRKYDIISVPSYAAGVYHMPKAYIIPKVYHPFRQGTDIIERNLICLPNQVSFMERTTGVEPALQAWEASVLPINYVRELPLLRRYIFSPVKAVNEQTAASRLILHESS